MQKSCFLDQSPTHRYRVSIQGFAVCVAAELWGRNFADQQREAGIYSEYYNAKVDCLDTGRVFPSSHREVLEIVNFVKEKRHRKLIDLRVDLLGLRPVPAWLKATDETALGQVLAFGASVWLFVDTALWQEDESLHDYVRRIFLLTSKPFSSDADVGHLTARALCHVGGIELVWTSDICQHLRLDVVNRKHPQLFLFRHSSYLSSQTDAGQKGKYVGAIAALTDMDQISSHRDC